MKRSRVIVAAALTVTLLLGAVVVAYASHNPNRGVVPPAGRVQGLTYGEWLGKWWYYALTLPASQNPLNSATGANCVFQRIGDVGLVLGDSTIGQPIQCQVPAGMMVFVEVLGAECSTLEEAPFHGANEQELRACAQGFVPKDLSASIDGVDVKSLERYISISPVFDFEQLDDNLLGVPVGSSGQSVGSGAYLLLTPMSAGPHTVRLHGTYPELDYTADKVFEFAVTP